MSAWIMAEVFINFLQIYIIYKVLELFYDRRLSFRFSVEILIIIMTIMLTGLNHYSQIQSNPLLYISFFLFILITSAIVFKGNIFLKLIILFLLLAVTGTLEMLAAALITTVGGFDLKTIQEQNNVRLEVMILSQTFFVYFYLLMRKRFGKNKLTFLITNTIFL